MAKSPDIINEVINNPRLPFRKPLARNKKQQRNRYLRRKVKEMLHCLPLQEEI